ncbi:MAG TPA: isopentenyl-diphosphate delta-isomerase [Candidatus Poseidoniales archaeon]|nr:MAG TPA: isopentenyl-diphosphate delta-isomerase [Candidatus Poseidoniales archaeon]HII58211.1 isopentenyl-diphosphate delta-isomerase [Candidatus Poseidoniaceae archaeon]
MYGDDLTGYQIDDVPSVEIDTELQQVLQQNSADEEQITLMSEAVIAVDELDNEIGKVSKVAAHYDAGQLHRAFSVLLFNQENKLLLQKRASHKVTFPNVWANSCCSHPLYSESERDLNDAMGVKRAAIRKLHQELGIDPQSISTDDFHFITKMMYSARMNHEWIEREIDHILIIKADVELNINENEVSDVKWVSEEELESMLVSEDLSDGEIAPWFRCIASIIMNQEWWSSVGDLAKMSSLSDNKIHDMGDISHMLTYATGAGLSTSIMEVKPLVEKRISDSLCASKHSRLSDAMMHLIEGGGKRLRATLPWLVGKAVGDSHFGLLDVGAAIEIVHNFTLVHDDIMDDDDTRRGLNAVHIEYGLPTAINAGDAMLAIAFERLVGAKGLDHKDVGAMVNRLAWMVRRVSEGQQLDIEFEDRIAVSEDDYFEMIEGKTAVMFLTCAEVGSRMAGADEETIQCMADWGLAVGLCFQLMDDLIDVLSDSDTLGKPAGSDLAQGKRTLMVIHALAQNDSEDLNNLKSVLGKAEDATQDEIDLGLLALNNMGSVDYARKKAEMYHSKAHACLDRLPDSPAILALRELTDYQLKRIS